MIMNTVFVSIMITIIPTNPIYANNNSSHHISIGLQLAYLNRKSFRNISGTEKVGLPAKIIRS